MVIVGGGVAALEGALALAQLAPDLTDVTVIAPNIELVDRAMIVPAQFGYTTARRYRLQRSVHAAGADLLSGELD